jgi:hypothetical protein
MQRSIKPSQITPTNPFKNIVLTSTNETAAPTTDLLTSNPPASTFNFGVLVTSANESAPIGLASQPPASTFYFGARNETAPTGFAASILFASCLSFP